MSNIIVFALYLVISAFIEPMAVQEDLTSIRVSWSIPTTLGYTIGYKIYYSDGDSSDSVDVSNGSTDNYLLTDLQSGGSYTLSLEAISIVAIPELMQSINVDLSTLDLYNK